MQNSGAKRLSMFAAWCWRGTSYSSGDNVAVFGDFGIFYCQRLGVAEELIVRNTYSVLGRVAQQSLLMLNVDYNLNFAPTCVLILLFFFFHWRYSPLWALACRILLSRV
jgi:hypothetical protein